MAKESVVSTLEILFADGISGAITMKMALPLLTFSLLYTPCVAALASIKRELGVKWAFEVAFFQLGVAWIMTFIVHLFCLI